jgi:Rho-type GTPase-activating protein 1/2
VPQPSYRNNRNSAVISGDLNTADGDSFFIPVALDPSPVASVTPRSTSDVLNEVPKKTKDGDYFAIPKGSGSEKKTDSQSSTPHIAFQEKARHSSSEYENPPAKAPSRKLSKRDKRIPITGSPVVADERHSRAANGKSDEFKLQEAPKSKKFGGSRNNSQSGIKVENAARNSNGILPSTAESESPPGLSTGETDSTPRSSSQEVRFRDDDGSRPSPEPSRADSGNARAILRKELPPGAGRPREHSFTSCLYLCHCRAFTDLFSVHV